MSSDETLEEKIKYYANLAKGDKSIAKQAQKLDRNGILDILSKYGITEQMLRIRQSIYAHHEKITRCTKIQTEKENADAKKLQKTEGLKEILQNKIKKFNSTNLINCFE